MPTSASTICASCSTACATLCERALPGGCCPTICRLGSGLPADPAVVGCWLLRGRRRTLPHHPSRHHRARRRRGLHGYRPAPGPRAHRPRALCDRGTRWETRTQPVRRLPGTGRRSPRRTAPWGCWPDCRWPGRRQPSWALPLPAPFVRSRSSRGSGSSGSGRGP